MKKYTEIYTLSNHTTKKPVWLHRSLQATFVEKYLKSTYGKYFQSAENAEKHMAMRAQKEDEEYHLPKRHYLSTAESYIDENCQILRFSNDFTSNKTVLYIHGGGYINEMTKYHVAFCDKLSAESKINVLAPIYPLAPNHTYKETYQIIERLYLKEINAGRDVILIGDSAGGGFVLAFTEYLIRNGHPTPSHVVAFSPWVDVSMSGSHYENYEKYDPMLTADGTRPAGKKWAGDADVKNYRISPLFGQIEHLPDTTIFVGTREVICPDVIDYYNKAINNKNNVSLYIGEGLNHVFPLYPIPEAKAALKEIVHIIGQ